MRHTTHYNLKLPEAATDYVDIEDLNDNFEEVDSVISDLRNDVDLASMNADQTRESLIYYGDIETVPSDDGYFVFSESGVNAEVAGGPETAGSITIPHHGIIDDSRYKVVSIANNGFYGYTLITSVILPNSITSIGTGAFSGCTGITQITIPDSVMSFGEYAFNGCTGLTDIYYSGSQDEWEAITGIDDSGIPATAIIHYDQTPALMENVKLHNTSNTSHQDLRDLIAIALKDLEINTWADVQAIVRAGLAPKVFSIGGYFEVARGNDILLFDIIGFDHDTPADPDFTHSMTLQLHGLFTANFDSPEAAFYVPAGLAAGTYNFTWENSTGSIPRGTYHFTVTEDVPAGGQIQIEAGATSTPLTSRKITTYAAAGDAEALESNITISGGESEGDANIGALKLNSAPTGSVNNAQYAVLGSSDWETSGIRQWLNSDGEANTWWEPQTLFDRPTNADKNGFLYGMEPEFLAVLGEVTKTTQKSIVEGYGHKTTTEKFFLLSRSEVYGGTERAEDGADGTPYAYYTDRSDLSAPGSGADTNRVKYGSSSAGTWYLRTPLASVGYNADRVKTTGAVDYVNVSTDSNAAPACVIV